jgi:Flp pilus assembly protein TadD
MLFRFSLAQALCDEGDSAEAIPHLQICADSRDDWMLPRILLGKAMLQREQEAEAKPILEKALQLAIDQHHLDPAEELREILADL